MDIKIDWLSFTVPLTSGTGSRTEDTRDFLLKVVNQFTDNLLTLVVDWRSPEILQGKGFYASLIIDKATGARFSWGDINSHVFIELTGVACDAMRTAGILHLLLPIVAKRASRVDISGDTETELQPEHVIGSFYRDNDMTYSLINTDDGQTVYIGSRKSEKFLRVYRYREPHPRAALLRIEFELKGDRAKQTIDEIMSNGTVQTFQKFSNGYKWDTDALFDDAWTEGKLKARKYDREPGGSLIWILEQVKPALIKAHRDGLIDITEFFKVIQQEIEK